MPFFTDKFKSPLFRKNSKEKTGDDLQPSKPKNNIELNLSGVRSEFCNGKWYTEITSEDNQEKKDLKQMLVSLQEENNLLKLKNEILIDMLAESSTAMVRFN